ncbi:7577_t:CDS:1, partial [Funneliformis caledonium]
MTQSKHYSLTGNYIQSETLHLKNELSKLEEEKRRLESSVARLEDMENHLELKYLEDLKKILDELGGL